MHAIHDVDRASATAHDLARHNEVHLMSVDRTVDGHLAAFATVFPVIQIDDVEVVLIRRKRVGQHHRRRA